MNLYLKLFLIEIIAYVAIQMLRSVMAPESDKIKFSTIKTIIKAEVDE